MRVTHPYRWALGVTVLVVGALAAGAVLGHPSADPSAYLSTAPSVAPFATASVSPPADSSSAPSAAASTSPSDVPPADSSVPPPAPPPTSPSVRAGTPTAAFGPELADPDLMPVAERKPVPDFTGIAQWINSQPLHESALRGRVVLVDFWTYSCVNCTRTIPHLRALYDAYRDRGLVVVGVHTPEFDFEKDPENVRAACRRQGVTWPVALDSDKGTWNAFDNEYWPAEYLVDRQGHIAYVHIGEGDYDTTAGAVVALLGSRATPAPVPPASAGPGGDTTPELYAGSGRGSLGDGERYGSRGEQADYRDHGAPRQPDRITVAGRWIDEVQYLQSATAGHVRLRFHAHDLYIVSGSATGSPLQVSVTLDGSPVPDSLRGSDLGPDGLTVTGPDLRQVLRGLDGGEHVIDLTVPAGLRLYTFTFG